MSKLIAIWAFLVFVESRVRTWLKVNVPKFVHWLVGLEAEAESLRGYINEAELARIVRSTAAAGGGVGVFVHTLLAQAPTWLAPQYADSASWVLALGTALSVLSMQRKRFMDHGADHVRVPDGTESEPPHPDVIPFRPNK